MLLKEPKTKTVLTPGRGWIALWCCAGVVGFMSLGCPAALSQEAISFGRSAKETVLVAYAAPSSRPAVVHSAFTASRSANRVVEKLSFDPQQHETALAVGLRVAESAPSDDAKLVRSLLRDMSRPHLRADADMGIQFLHKKMPSRFAYDSWTGVEASYGQFLADDALGRSRTSGAGVQDPDWFYLKMSFKF